MRTRVGIIGLGRIGHAFGASPQDDPLSHSEAFARCPEAAVAWAIDPDPVQRASMQRRIPGATVYANVPQAEVPATDVVCICSPTSAHAEGIELALQAGARVIVCEKPIASTAVASQALVDRCRAAGCVMIVNYFRRFSPLLGHLRRAAVEGVLVGPVRGVIRYDGGLVHNGTHWIDLCRAMFGDVRWARALPVAEDDGADRPRTVELSFDAGRTVLLAAVSGFPYSVAEADFIGGNGGMRFVDSGAILSTFGVVDSPIWAGYRKPGPQQVVTTEGLRGSMLALAAHAVALARDGGDPICSGADGVAALRAAESAVHSLQAARQA
jgi:predicted dehydrogenase